MTSHCTITHKYNLFNRLDRACLLLSSDATYDDLAEEAKCTVHDVRMYVDHRIAELQFRSRNQALLEKLQGYAIDPSNTP